MVMANLLAAAALIAADSAPQVQLTPTTEVRFASVEQGKAILTANDEFASSLSRFDLQCRLKTDKDVSLDEWKQQVGQQVRPWEAAETDMIRESLARLQRRLADLRLPLPPLIHLVRTSGEEESNAAYTRSAAIILPTRVLSYDTIQFDRLLAHELFHLMSRHDGAVRTRLYRVIGFEVCEPIALPASLRDRKVTNPDAPRVDCTISLPTKDGKTIVGAPLLYSPTRQYDAKKAQSLFQSFVFRLLVVERQREGGPWQPAFKSGQPVVINPRDEPAFIEKVGQNTNYIIHPDEILADNFVRLVMQDENVPTPRIIKEMRRVLTPQ